jgi:hypothetical protein
MGSKINSQFLRMSIGAGVIVLAMGGCYHSSTSGGNFPPPGAAMANGQPIVPADMSNCTLISSSSPTKYECGGKQYTTFDLYRARKARENYKNVGGGPSETVLQQGSKQQ